VAGLDDFDMVSIFAQGDIAPRFTGSHIGGKQGLEMN
jgi:hypothetical protein